MERTMTTTLLAGLVLVGAALPAAAEGTPTCGGIVGVVHGHHVVGDYVTGVGHDDLVWPPAGQANARGGAALPGGPGPAFHFEHGIAPGASFCNPQSRSPGFHVGG